MIAFKIESAYKIAKKLIGKNAIFKIILNKLILYYYEWTFLIKVPIQGT